jgi:L-alanine-DL-glutamate epimerase-like enolase superfamily enzyme
MQLTCRPFGLELVHPWRIARGTGTTTYPVLLVELRDASGLTGLGESAPSSRYQENVASGQAFLGRVDLARLRFDDVRGSMAYLDSLAPGEFSAKCAVNLALLDGAARRAGQALYDHLGLGFRERHHVTSFSIGLDTPEVIRQKTLAAASYPVLKLKVGAAGDRENLAALRSVAPTKPVRVDANEGWPTKEAALERIEWLAQDGHIQFVEQPMPSTVPASDWAWLKARSPLPIFADESYRSAADLSRVVDGFHGVNVKLVKTGGVSAGFEALSAARRAGLKTMIGCMIETSVLISAAAHLAGLCDHLDVDGNLLTKNDPFLGVTAEQGILSFTQAPEPHGLRVRAR